MNRLLYLGCIAHHLALPSSFCFATARSNEQNQTKHAMTAATSSELPDVLRRVLHLQNKPSSRALRDLQK